MTQENSQVDVNITDLVIVGGTVMAVANTENGIYALAGIGLYSGYRWFFNLRSVRAWIDRVRVKLPANEVILPWLLPAPKEINDSIPLLQSSSDSFTVNNIDPYEGMSLWQRARQKPVSAQNTIKSVPLAVNDEVAVLKRQSAVEAQQVAFAKKAFKTLPMIFHHDDIPEAPSKLAVPIGINYQQEVIWGDFSAQKNDLDTSRLLHVLVSGKTGSGKDNLLRVWYKTLTTNNTPNEIQFVILDGKGDWLTPQVANSPYMAIPPAGGIDYKKIDGKRVDCGADRMLTSVDWVFDELERRQTTINAAGATDIFSYKRRTGKSYPYLFVMAVDVGEQLTGDLVKLIKQLISKGRAYGIRLLINMQNPVGEDTKWRSQLGAIITGHQGDARQDHHIMGASNVALLQLRPSQLPDPEQYEGAKGLFIIKQGNKQDLIRAPYLPEMDWEDYLDELSTRFVVPHDDFFDTLLAHADELKPKPVKKLIVPQDVLTKEQIVLIVQLTRKGVDKTTIMVKHLKFTSNYSEKKDAVQKVIDIARGGLS